MRLAPAALQRTGPRILHDRLPQRQVAGPARPLAIQPYLKRTTATLMYTCVEQAAIAALSASISVE
jgi:hypothetical protein